MLGKVLEGIKVSWKRRNIKREWSDGEGVFEKIREMAKKKGYTKITICIEGNLEYFIVRKDGLLYNEDKMKEGEISFTEKLINKMKNENINNDVILIVRTYLEGTSVSVRDPEQSDRIKSVPYKELRGFRIRLDGFHLGYERINKDKLKSIFKDVLGSEEGKGLEYGQRDVIFI